MTEAQRAIEDAKAATRTETATVIGADAARVALELVLGHDPENGNDKSSLIGSLDLTKLLTDEGKVDTAKVRALAAQIAPADKGTGGGSHDFGAGRRGTGGTKSGLAAGAELYEASRTGTAKQ